MSSARPVRDLVVGGASAGGVEALKALTADLPADLPATVLVALHLSVDARSYLTQILQRRCRLEVRPGTSSTCAGSRSTPPTSTRARSPWPGSAGTAPSSSRGSAVTSAPVPVAVRGDAGCRRRPRAPYRAVPDGRQELP